MLLVSGTKRKPGSLRKPINSTQDHGYSLCVLRKNNEARTQPHARKRKRGESADDRRARTYHRISEVSADELLSKGTSILTEEICCMQCMNIPLPKIHVSTVTPRCQGGETRVRRRRED